MVIACSRVRRGGLSVGAATVVLLFAARPLLAVCQSGPEVQWLPENGGNGHFYQALCGPSNWNQANNALLAEGRHLATIGSAEENAFVFSLIDDQGFWTVGITNCNLGPWLGGFQPPGSGEPSEGWSWITGEPFSFTAWHAGEPNQTAGLEQDHLHFLDCSGGEVRSAQWNDTLASNVFPGYVAERVLHSLDIDGDGEIQALTDGLLILRWLFGLTGPALVHSAVDLSDCTRCTAETIAPILASLTAALDVDGDGEALALTDGLLILRWLFGLTGPPLVNDAVDLSDCTRCDAVAIEGFLGSLD